MLPRVGMAKLQALTNCEWWPRRDGNAAPVTKRLTSSPALGSAIAIPLLQRWKLQAAKGLDWLDPAGMSWTMSSSLPSGTCAMCFFLICTITIARGRIARLGPIEPKELPRKVESSIAARSIVWPVLRRINKWQKGFRSCGANLVPANSRMLNRGNLVVHLAVYFVSQLVAAAAGARYTHCQWNGQETGQAKPWPAC